MRAVYLEIDFSEGESIVLSGVDAHHLINVVRIKVGESIILLDGLGRRGLAKVESCSKRNLELICTSIEKVLRSSTRFSLAIGQLKKDALDDVLKASCELGVETLYILKTERSQKYDLNLKRIRKILISGIEQSNHAYLPNLIEVNLSDLPWQDFDATYLFTLLSEGEKDQKLNPKNKNNLIIIGPEGGFSSRDIEQLPASVTSSAIYLDLPILRAPTAFSCAFGYLHAYC